ncbi:unnamed protein product, partial [Amoebophrya sp. A25]|eukprot:GSA25T00008892001.1
MASITTIVSLSSHHICFIAMIVDIVTIVLALECATLKVVCHCRRCTKLNLEDIEWGSSGFELICLAIKNHFFEDWAFQISELRSREVLSLELWSLLSAYQSAYQSLHTSSVSSLCIIVHSVTIVFALECIAPMQKVESESECGSSGFQLICLAIKNHFFEDSSTSRFE